MQTEEERLVSYGVRVELHFSRLEEQSLKNRSFEPVHPYQWKANRESRIQRLPSKCSRTCGLSSRYREVVLWNPLYRAILVYQPPEETTASATLSVFAQPLSPPPLVSFSPLPSVPEFTQPPMSAEEPNLPSSSKPPFSATGFGQRPAPWPSRRY